MNKVVTRFAPSPTGLLHSGNYRTAVFAYLFARKNKGEFILRIEDTDKERSKKEFEANIIDSLKWLEISWDALYHQSERTEIYEKYLKQLVEEDKAYVSQETPTEAGQRTEVIRFRNPGGPLTFTDLIRGEITTDTADLGDFIIARSFTEPLYHLAVVIDDHEMGVSHVIRGEDHIANTPRQILIRRAIGGETPFYVHLPLVLASDRTKLSKRRDAKALTEYRDAGLLPEAMLNYLTLLGWNPGGTEEFFTREQLIELFDFARVQRSGAIFDETKLLSVNQHWMRLLSDEDYIKRGELTAPDEGKLRLAIPLLKERAKTFGEAREMLTGELSCLFLAPHPEEAQLLAKASKEATKGHLEALKGLVASLSDLSSAEAVKAALMPYADAIPKEVGGRGAALWPLRYSLSGAERSPDPFTLIFILGKEESIRRIDTALGILG